MEENRIEEEINLDEIDTSKTLDDIDISFSPEIEKKDNKKEDISFELEENNDDVEDGSNEEEPNKKASDEEDNNDFEDSISGPDEKGMTEADYKKWAQEYNCSEEEVIEALDMGWHGPKGFSKDKTFLTPTEFLEKSKKNAPIMYQRWKQAKQEAEESRKMQKQMYDSILDIQRKNTQQALAEQRKTIEELEKKLKTAKEDFDVEEIEKLALEKYKLEKEQQSQMEKQEVRPNNNWDRNLELDWIENSETAQIIKADPMMKIKAAEVVRLLDNDPIYRDWTSEQRIAYLERQFGSKKVTKPAATMVGRASSGAVKSQEITWNDVPDDFKKLSLELAQDFPWWSTRNSDEKSKKAFESYKKDIINSYKKGV